MADFQSEYDDSLAKLGQQLAMANPDMQSLLMPPGDTFQGGMQLSSRGPDPEIPAGPSPFAPPAATPPAAPPGPSVAPPAPAAAPTAAPTDDGMPPSVVQYNAFHKNPNGFTSAITGYESNGNPNAKNPLSSAEGLYQITDGTYADLMRRHPELQLQGKNDPRAFQALTKDNADVLRQGLGREPSVTDLKAAHFLGAAGAIKFLSAPPDTPVDQVVSPDALAANRNVFFDKSGKPFTVGQVYAASQQVLMGPGGPQMPRVSAQSPTNPGQAQPAGFDPNAGKLFDQQRQAYDKYIASQPDMWSKLKTLQQNYMQASQPSFSDKLSDTMAQYQQQQAAADANLHSNAGGILLHAEPNAQPFIDSLKSSHAIDMDARKANLDRVKQGYDMESSGLLGQANQQKENLGLLGNMNSDQLKYALETKKMELELAQLGVTQARDKAAYLVAAIPNAETRAQIANQISASGNTNESLSDYQKRVDAAVQTAQKGGQQIAVKESSQIFKVSWNDPKTGQTMYDSVDVATPQGRQRLQDLAKEHKENNFDAQNMNVPTTTNTITNGGGEGKPSGEALDSQHSVATNTINTVAAAKLLVNYLSQPGNGGTGALTGPDAIELGNKIRQLTGLDPLKIPAREMLNKLLSQVQTQETISSLRGLQRQTGAEFQQAKTGSLSDVKTSEAINAYLDHVQAAADWNKRRIEFLSQAETDATSRGNKNFNRVNEAIKWQNANPMPQWVTGELTPEPEKPTTAPTADPTSGNLVEGQTGMAKNGRPTIVKDGAWHYQ